MARKTSVFVFSTICSMSCIILYQRTVIRDLAPEWESFSGKYEMSSIIKEAPALKIAIIVVIDEQRKVIFYRRAIDSLKCYAKIHKYDFIIADFSSHPNCHQRDKFFQRHCVVGNYLKNYDYVLFLDADMGVVNPKRKIEEFVDERFDVTFYDRFYNQEIVAGAYLLKNSDYAKDFINGFADYEKQLPQSFHGTDNGGLHAYVLSKIFPDRQDEYQICLEIYKRSRNYDDLFSYEACVRKIIGIGEEFGKIRILRKGTGWARDSWLVNSLFNPDRDFMLHGWKMQYLRKYTLPIKPAPTSDKAIWYDPIIGQFDINLCRPGNETWNFDRNLIAPIEVINKTLAEYKQQVQFDEFRRLSSIPSMLGF